VLQATKLKSLGVKNKKDLPNGLEKIVIEQETFDNKELN
jgi:hypothetical protein